MSNYPLGSDEVGTGDFFGPIIVTSCYLKAADYSYLQQIGITDSKALTDTKILHLGEMIKDRILHQTMILNPKTFNQETRKGKNLNMIKAYMHNYALNKLVATYQFKEVPMIDQFCPKELYYSYLKRVKKVICADFEVKAETKYLSVATASCLARYYFLLELDKMNQKYHLVFPKGAGPKVDQFGKNFIKQYSTNELSLVSKINFKNYKRIIE